MAFKIIWSPEAEITFEDIITYLEDHWSEKEIRNFILETQKTIFFLKQNPFLLRGSEKENVHEVLIGKQNLLLYRIIESSKRVELLSFWDGRKNPGSKFHK